MQTRSNFRLLVVRLGAMGDILHALPAVTALRQLHPSWVIDWVVEPRWRALLAAEGSCGRIKNSSQPNPAQPIVDKIHLAATKDWRKAPLNWKTLQAIGGLRTALQADNYDVAIDLQGGIRSALLATFAGCRRLIGEAEPRESVARLFFSETVAPSGAHVIEQDIELAASIAGDDLQYMSPWLPVDAVAETWADAILPASGSQKTVLINPGAGWGAKRWPVERYAVVAQSLIARGLRVLVNAGPGEEPLAESIAQQTNGAAQPVACTLAQLMALIRRVGLVIAGDTGPLHLACALGKPVVGIYGPTDPSRNGPYGVNFKVLRSPESRRDHTRLEAPEAGLLTIQPGEVLLAIEEILNAESTK